MTKAAKRANGNYIEAGYKDKIVFRRKELHKAGRTVVAQAGGEAKAFGLRILSSKI